MAGPLRAAFKGYVALRLYPFQGLVVQWYNLLCCQQCVGSNLINVQFL